MIMISLPPFLPLSENTLAGIGDKLFPPSVVSTPVQVKGANGKGWFNATGADFPGSSGNTIFGTKYEATPWNWFRFIVLFGWVWMWFI